MENKGKYVLITGATAGIGKELAKLFAADGYNLVIVSRDQQTLDDTAQELGQHGVEVTTMVKDLFDNNAAFQVYDEVKAKGIDIDVLVNNAGQGAYGEFVEADIDRDISIIHLNVISLTILTKQFLKDMVSRGQGKILNLSSVASKIPGPYQAVYHATKAYVQSFTEAIRSECKDSGVTITALLPGATDTDFFAKADMLDAKNIREGKLDDPAKVAKDGYDALMSGKDKVVSGIKNKVQVAMANVLPESMVAENTKKQQAPASEDEKNK